MNLSLSLRFHGYSIMHVLHSSKSDDAPRWCVKKEEKTMPSYYNSTSSCAAFFTSVQRQLVTKILAFSSFRIAMPDQFLFSQIFR